MRFRTLAAAVSALALAALLPVGGCFNPNGGVTGYFAYMSTPMSPKTVIIYDMRTEEPFFIQDIPVGKQLNFRFLQDGGDDPSHPGRSSGGSPKPATMRASWGTSSPALPRNPVASTSRFARHSRSRSRTVSDIASISVRSPTTRRPRVAPFRTAATTVSTNDAALRSHRIASTQMTLHRG